MNIWQNIVSLLHTPLSCQWKQLLASAGQQTWTIAILCTSWQNIDVHFSCSTHFMATVRASLIASDFACLIQAHMAWHLSPKLCPVFPIISRLSARCIQKSYHDTLAPVKHCQKSRREANLWRQHSIQSDWCTSVAVMFRDTVSMNPSKNLSSTRLRATCA